MSGGCCIAILCPSLCADSTLTINNLRTVTSSVRDLYGLGDYHFGLGVPRPVLREIRDNPAMTEEDKITKVLLYFFRNVPMASWEKIAGALYRRKEERALQAVEKFLTVSTGTSAVCLLCSSVALDTVTFDPPPPCRSRASVCLRRSFSLRGALAYFSSYTRCI